MQDISSVISIFSGLMIYNKDLMNSIVQHILEHPEHFAQVQNLILGLLATLPHLEVDQAD